MTPHERRALENKAIKARNLRELARITAEEAEVGEQEPFAPPESLPSLTPPPAPQK